VEDVQLDLLDPLAMPVALVLELDEELALNLR